MPGEHRPRTADGGPAYLAVADDLRSRILRGEYEPGTPLPDEQALAARYGLSTIVIRNALIQLRDWRLLQDRNVLPPPKALFAGIILRRLGPDNAVTEELLALDPRYVVLNRTDEDHMHFLIKQERIPVITSPGTTPVTEPARWLNVTLSAADEEITFNPPGCTLLIRTDLLPPQAAARTIHALAMA